MMTNDEGYIIDDGLLDEPPVGHTSYFTFGQGHTHVLNGTVYDKDCVVKITSLNPRIKMLELFGTVWAMEYDSSPVRKNPLLYPRGIFDLSDEPPQKKPTLVEDAYWSPKIEDHEILDRMEKYGGSFVQALANAMRKADLTNMKILKDNFRTYWNKYERQIREEQKHDKD